MKKKILDVMIDFETFGLQPESVPINLAVVAWNRCAEDNPFVIPGVPKLGEYHGTTNLPFQGIMSILDFFLNSSRFAIYHFDTCSCLLDGMTVDAGTQSWWSQQSLSVINSLQSSEREQMHPSRVLNSFAHFLFSLKAETDADDICIWSQGSDFDIAKLRWLFNKYSKEIDEKVERILRHCLFRDARTVIMELGNKVFDGKRGFSVDLDTGAIIIDGKPNKEDELIDFSDIYDRIPSLQEWAVQMSKRNDIATGNDGVMSNYLLQLASGDYAHNSIYDCMRSIYNVWWLNKALDTQMI